jgi:type IV pilus assembly protein PilO
VDEQEKKAKPASDPLEVDGMQRISLELAARGSYPQLLEFLRQLEALNVLVVQTDLQLNLEAAAGNAPAATGPAALLPRPVVLNMLLGLYNKNPQASKPGGSK